MDHTTSWQPRPSLALPRAGLGGATIGGRILAIGGWADEDYYDDVEARPRHGDGRWRTIEPLKHARGNLSTATLGDHVYAVGGLGPRSEWPMAVVERFDQRTGRWEPFPSLPRGRYAAGIAGLDGRLYVVGGGVRTPPGRSENSAGGVVYDARSHAWTSIAPMPTPRRFLRLAAGGRHLYAIGGLSDAGRPVGDEVALATVERYDPRDDVWTTVAPMHEARGNPGAVTVGSGSRQRIVVVGGRAGDGPRLRTTEIYVPATDTWHRLDALLPYGRSGLVCELEDDHTVLAIGGAVDDEVPGPTGLVEALDLRDALASSPDGPRVVVG